MVGKTSDMAGAKDQQRRQDGEDGAADGDRSVKDKIAHPFPETRQKVKHTQLYDLKVLTSARTVFETFVTWHY